MKKLLILTAGFAALLFSGCSAIGDFIVGDTNTSETQNTVADNSCSDQLSSSSVLGDTLSSSLVSSSSSIEPSSTISSPGSSSSFSPRSSGDRVNVQVKYNNGAIAARVQVQLFSESDWEQGMLDGEGPVSQTLIADENGVVTFPELSDDNWTMLIEDSGEGAFVEVDTSIDGGVVVTQPMTGHTGNLGGAVPENPEICLQGTPYCSVVDENGDFEFSSLPPGFFDVAFRDDQNKTITAVEEFKFEPTNAEIDSLYYQRDYILLEDFQDKDHYGVLSTWSGNGHWWIVHDGAWTTPAENLVMSEGMIEDSDVPGNFIYKMEVNFFETGNLNWVSLGLNLGEGFDIAKDNVWADISQMDSVTVRIWGEGNIEFYLQSSYTYEDYKDFYVPLTLSPGWNEVTILPTDFIRISDSIAEQNNITFTQAATRTGAVVFRFLDAGTYQLDDLKIHGVEMIRLYPGSDKGFL